MVCPANGWRAVDFYCHLAFAVDCWPIKRAACCDRQVGHC